METAGMRKLKKPVANLDKNIDPDFGTQSLEAVEAYFVIVTPTSDDPQVMKDYVFVALLPEMESQDGMNELLREILQQFLNVGDQYTARRFTHEDYDTFGGDVPVLAYHPEKEDEFFWLRPPRHIMH
jgi:hypothetical protein